VNKDILLVSAAYNQAGFEIIAGSGNIAICCSRRELGVMNVVVRACGV
jgi:hypothetical protein